MDWIQGNKFQEIATYTYAPEVLLKHDYAKIPNNLDIEKLKDGDIIYCAGFIVYKKALLELIKDTKQVVLISHNCDEGIDDSFEVPDNVIKWYGQNIKVVHPRIESIPTGLGNNRWQPKKMKKEKLLKKATEKKTFRNLVYMDHRTWNNPKERIRPYEVLGNKPFVTSFTDNHMVSYEMYIDNVYNHRFVVSPEGNGVQTHRTWEAMYLRSIPIEKKNINNTFYTDLPICFVDDWEQVTESFLINWLIDNQDRKWNMDMLYFQYWKDKILNT